MAMSPPLWVLVVGLSIAQVLHVDAAPLSPLTCYTCDDPDDPDDCTFDEVTCEQDEVCYSILRKERGHLHPQLGCMKKETCYELEGNNTDRCDSGAFLDGDRCAFCCQKPHCNVDAIIMEEVPTTKPPVTDGAKIAGDGQTEGHQCYVCNGETDNALCSQPDHLHTCPDNATACLTTVHYGSKHSVITKMCSKLQSCMNLQENNDDDCWDEDEAYGKCSYCCEGPGCNKAKIPGRGEEVPDNHVAPPPGAHQESKDNPLKPAGPTSKGLPRNRG
ncbi:uncharacterized protein LOC124261564 [Haliotis rubra]|uniref:uncharacterized protein LOC124261564 n=1 Tax=Haliotis rubra TaxID=36100 RepID=UPI001EE542D5|nr:uncharacterized protein LOC124261564 [Haliotis rubra]